jgi:AraC-like DNA-binding protein
MSERMDHIQQAPSFEDRLDRVLESFVQEAGARSQGPEIADQAQYSLAQTHRLFKRRFGEAPGALRRRLVLERAADLLSRSQLPIWKVAVESGFGSTESFARAFRRAYRVSPREFRARSDGASPWLPAPSAVHFWRGSLLRSMRTGGLNMTITQRMVEHDLSDTRRLLDRAQTLSAAHLDAKLDDPKPRLFLECYEATIRGRLDYLILTKEVWLAAVHARLSPAEGPRDLSVKGMLARFEKAEKEWRDLVQSVEREGRMDEMFIDALCEQPNTFSFGGMIAHVLDHSARNRTEVYRAFCALGHEDVCDGDPLNWEQKRAS